MRYSVDNVILNLNTFIKKYYKNNIWQGLLIFFSFSLLFILVFSAVEYFFWLESSVRLLIIVVFVIYAGFLFYNYVLIHFFNLINFKRGLSTYQAAKIISIHFPEMCDYLINTLELRKLKTNHNFSLDLVIASIEQKDKQIKIFNFTEAIPFHKVYRFLYVLFGIILIYFLIAFVRPGVYSEGSYRLYNYEKQFFPKPPFNYKLLSENLFVEKGSDFTFLIQLSGNEVPLECFIQVGNNKFLMVRKSGNIFEFVFKAINNSIKVDLIANELSFASFNLIVVPSPQIKEISVDYDFPDYTFLKDLKNQVLASISLPVGTTITWNVETIFTDSVFLNVGNFKNLFLKDNYHFKCNYLLKESIVYGLSVCNDNFKKHNILEFSINSIPDLYPEISVVNLKDTIYPGLYYFKGLISDDYGINGLYFCYNKESNDSIRKIKVPYDKDSKSQEFYFSFDFNAFEYDNKKVKYYFEVYDNDGFNGSKCTKSDLFNYTALSFEELSNLREDLTKSVEKDLNESLKMANELKNDIGNLKKSVLSEDMSSFERAKMVENIQRKQLKLDRLLQNLKDKTKQNNELHSSFNISDKEILETQKEIEKLLGEILNDEIKKMLEELKNLSEQFDKSKMKDVMDNLKFSYEDLKKQLDRDLELLKRYKIEEQLNTLKSKLEQLSINEENISKELSEKGSAIDYMDKTKEDKDVFKKMEDIYDKMQNENKELIKPYDLDNVSDDFNEINQDFDNSLKEQEKGNSTKASKWANKASQKLKSLSSKFENMKKKNMADQNAENFEDLKMVLDNLLKFSFAEEELISSLSSLKFSDPNLKNISRFQKKFQNDFRIIRDSLISISKRNPKIENSVIKDVFLIENEMDKVIINLDEGKSSVASVSCQYIMTSANNLAVLLSESLDDMDSMMQNSGEGNGNCKKKKPGKPGLQGLKSQQENFKNQIQKMIDQMKNGQNSGNGKMSNEQVGRMLAEQEMMQKMLSEFMNSSGTGSKASDILKDVNKLIEDNKRDLLFHNFNQQFLERQHMITTRLLEAEKSEKEREIDNQRESNENLIKRISNPKSLFEYNKENIIFNENLFKQNLNLNYYYVEKHKKYIQNLNSIFK